MNLLLFGCYGMCDGYSYCNYFKEYFLTVSFFPVYELNDRLNENHQNFSLYDIDNIIKGDLNKNYYTDRLINHNIKKDIIIILHNNEFIKNNIIIKHIIELKNIYQFKLLQINWDVSINELKINENFDLSFNSNPNMILHNKNALFFKSGFCIDKSYYKIDDNYKCDVSIICTNLYEGWENNMRKNIVDLLYDNNEIKFYIYGTNNIKNKYPNKYKGFINYDNCNLVFSNSTFNLNISPVNDITQFGYHYFSERLGQIIGCNSIMISNNDYKNMLIPNYHYIYIKNIEDLIPTILKYKDDTNFIMNMKKNISNIRNNFNYKNVVKNISLKILSLYEQKNFNVIAKYGKNDNYIDVSNIIIQNLINNNFVININNSTFNHDPCKNIIKELIINGISINEYDYYLFNDFNINIVCDKTCKIYFIEYYESIIEKFKKFKINCNLIITDVLDYVENEYNNVYLYFGMYPINKFKNNYRINTEQCSRKNVINHINKYDSIVFDYDKYQSIKYKLNYLPYQINDIEINKLQNNSNKYNYDICIMTLNSSKRKDIYDILIKNEINVLVIDSYGDLRDEKIKNCKILLNIHYSDDYNIYEHLRCDRWLFSNKLIITENTPSIDYLDYKDLLIIANYNEIVETVLNVINDFDNIYKNFTIKLNNIKKKLIHERELDFFDFYNYIRKNLE